MDFTEGKSVMGEGVAEVRRGALGVRGRHKIAQAIWQFHPPARCHGFDTVSTPETAIRAIPRRHHGDKKNQPLQYIVTVSYPLINPLHPTC